MNRIGTLRVNGFLTRDVCRMACSVMAGSGPSCRCRDVQGSLEGAREVPQEPMGSQSLCSRKQGVGYQEKRRASQAARCGGHI